MKFRNALVAQSGGPTVAINATLAGVIRRCMESEEIHTIYGALHGIEGLLDEKIVDIGEKIRSKEDLKRLALTPAMALGSCRYRLPAVEDGFELYEKIHAILERHEIGVFFYIGGNDSMDTAWKLSQYFQNNKIDIQVIGVPKTIDNDLPVTDHTPGYGSAAKFVATSLLEIGRDCAIYNIPAVTIVEIMGRHAGWLTAAAAVPLYFGAAAPHLIYLPEVVFDPAGFIFDVRKQMEQSNAVVVAVSEGIKTADGSFIGSSSQSAGWDVFGHMQLSGAGKSLESLIKKEIGCKVRSVELNILQRCASHTAALSDLKEAEAIGAEAVTLALNGYTGKCMTFIRTSNDPYRIEIAHCDLNQVANQEKKFPVEWINAEGNGIRREGIEYILPLIKGSVETIQNGYIPEHFEGWIG